MSVGTVLAIVAVAIVVTLVVTVRRGRGDRVGRVYEAALTGDRDLLRQRIGRSVDRRDRDGNTALHLAYYRGRQEAVDALVAFGADENLRNKEHLLPAEMREMAEIEDLLTAGAACLDTHGDWLDPDRGRVVYDRLRDRKPRIYNPALVRRVLAGERQTALLHLAIKLGVFRSEAKLVEILHGYGTVAMATDYLNCGSHLLRDAAEVWARRHGYTIHHAPGSRSLTWGRF